MPVIFGRVGIDFSMPQAALHINNFNDAIGIPALWVQNSNSGDAMYIDPYGYVGIGTTTPAHPLQVNGDAEVYNLYVDASTWMTGNTSIAQSLNVSVNSSVGGNMSVSGTSTLSGTVQIGTTKPVTSAYTPFLLSVAGNVVAQNVQVEVSDWADKVFDKSYNLRSLSDVESYLDQNKHLPDVPSECDAIERGVNLGEMNKVLLQKVEELTLYMIQQQKEIDALKNK